MKNVLYIFLLLPLIVMGQTGTMNYVKTATYRLPTSTTTVGNSPLVNIIYFDGLGRPIQQVASKASPKGKDIVTHIEYDQYSRQPLQYLPYPSLSATGQFDTGAKNNTELYYNTPAYENTSNPFSQAFYEPSPLNRVIKQAAPGLNWKGNPILDNDHTVKFGFQTNVSGEVRRFKVSFPDENNTEATELVTAGYYGANQLFKTITKDENWTTADGKCKTTEEFKDKAGRLVLKRTYVKKSNNQDDPLNTYYVYDRYENLTYVIPPQAAYQIVKNVLFTPVTKNYPFVKLVRTEEEKIDSYLEDISNYDNADILNIDLYDQYSGKGGFTVSVDQNGNLVLDINIITKDANEYTRGPIVSLDDIGRFSDAEIGRIKGNGYSYTFLIRNNSIEVDGDGYVPSMTKTLSTMQKIEYTKNYAWVDICNVDADISKKFKDDIRQLDNSEILSTYTPNEYNASGGVSVSLSDNDNLTLSLNINSDEDLELLTGSVFTLDIKRPLKDMTLGTVSGSGYSYQFAIVKNELVISGSGKFRTINFLGSNLNTFGNEINHEVENLCYIYHHDKRNRVVEKHIPDNGWTYIVYDIRNRPVMTQDENQRKILHKNIEVRPYDYNLWSFTEYDQLDKPVMSGILQSQDIAVNARQNFQALKNSTASNDPGLNAKRSIAPIIVNGGLSVYYNSRWDYAYEDTFELLTVNYYDDYAPFAVDNLQPDNINSVGAEIEPTAKGLATGNKVKVLDTNPGVWITAVIGYDDRARTVWTTTINPYLDTTNKVETLPLFTGEVSQSVTKHTKGSTTIIVYDKFIYDAAGRFLQHLQAQNPLWGWDLGPESNLIAGNSYDEVNKLVSKKVGHDINTPFQTISYDYNIRGWLKQVNNTEAMNSSLYAFKIGYNGLYNGNISSTEWKACNSGVGSYHYTYDDINRLTNASYGGDGIPSNTTVYALYSEGNIEYDKNGNIIKLTRQGLKDNAAFGEIDNLVYSYKPLSNQLLKVTDSSLEGAGFRDGHTGEDYDYDYDTNGNMVKDLNKGIGQVETEEIRYNQLNLPTTVIQDSDHKIKYVYDASGQKLQKQVTNGSGNTTITQYAGGFVYEDNVLQYFSHPEGYVKRETNGNFTYVYQYKDHLGNVRLSYADADADGTILDTQYFADGFENGISWADGYGGLLILDDTINKSGKFSVRLTSTNIASYRSSDQWVYINNSVATEYTFSAWVYGTSGAQITMFMVPEVEQNYIWSSAKNLEGTGWRKISKTYLVPANTKKLNLRLDIDGVGTAWFDDVSIKRTDGATEIIENNDYYPFGLEHKGNVVQATANIGQKIKYQGQERQDELGLGWDSFKWRNYDYAIGRFFNVDPLAAEYPYNSVYAFQENKMGMGRELEGLELAPFEFFLFSENPPVTQPLMNAAKVGTEIAAESSEAIEVHHIIPRALKNHEVVKNAREEGFKFEGAENKMPLPKFSKATGTGRHGPHPEYNKGLNESMKKPEGVSYLEFIRNVVSETKELIQSKPDTKINDIFKTEVIIESTSAPKPELPRRIIPKKEEKPKPSNNMEGVTFS